jgi:internalin A
MSPVGVRPRGFTKIAAVCGLLVFSPIQVLPHGRPQARSLLISSCGPSGLESKRPLLRRTSLNVRDHGQTPVEVASDETRELDYLRRVVRHQQKLGGGGLRRILALDLSDSEVTDDGMFNLARLENLSLLDLSFTSVGDSGLRRIEHLRQIQCLSLTGTRVTGATLSGVARMPRLSILRVDGTDVRGGLSPLRGCGMLTTLSLAGDRIGDDELAKLGDLVTLGELDVARTGTDGSFLRSWSRMSELSALNLSGNRQVDDKACVELAKLSKLRDLDLCGTSVGDVGLISVGALAGLRSLNLSDTLIRDEGLSNLRRLTGIASLDLNATRVTDAGVENLRHLTGLVNLSLRNTQASDSATAALRLFGNLRAIDVRGTRITAKGLSDLFESRSFRRIYVSVPAISLEAIERLRKMKDSPTIICEAERPPSTL